MSKALHTELCSPCRSPMGLQPENSLRIPGMTTFYFADFLLCVNQFWIRGCPLLVEERKYKVWQAHLGVFLFYFSMALPPLWEPHRGLSPSLGLFEIYTGTLATFLFIYLGSEHFFSNLFFTLHLLFSLIPFPELPVPTLSFHSCSFECLSCLFIPNHGPISWSALL